jgi:hypothetical protein
VATAPKFRIDVDIHNLLMHSTPGPVAVPAAKGMKLPDPVYPRFSQKLLDPGPDPIPEKRDWTVPEVYRKMCGWLFPYIRSRVLPGDFHPSRLTFSVSTSAISTVGIAGPTTTGSRG